VDADSDDVTQHLLHSASSRHLPPPGIEQVFESDSLPVTPFIRERPKLSREERIKLLKEKRESRSGLGLSLSDNAQMERSRSARMGWGPGADVVDELKDVIWKVGERRRQRLNMSIDETAEIPDDQLKPSMHRIQDPSETVLS